jgi:hypothetical protein
MARYLKSQQQAIDVVYPIQPQGRIARRKAPRKAGKTRRTVRNANSR